MDAAFGITMKRRHVPRIALRIGAAALARPKPDIASLMGMSYYSDTHIPTWNAEPLTSRGIDPRSVSQHISELAAAG